MFVSKAVRAKRQMGLLTMTHHSFHGEIFFSIFIFIILAFYFLLSSGGRFQGQRQIGRDGEISGSYIFDIKFTNNQ